VGYVTVNVDVDVDLYDIDTDELIDELERRGALPSGYDDCDADDNKNLLNIIYEAKRLGKDYERELDLLIFRVLGRIL
jgi:hypothetical protein